MKLPTTVTVSISVVNGTTAKRVEETVTGDKSDHLLLTLAADSLRSLTGREVEISFTDKPPRAAKKRKDVAQ